MNDDDLEARVVLGESEAQPLIGRVTRMKHQGKRGLIGSIQQGADVQSMAWSLVVFEKSRIFPGLAWMCRQPGESVGVWG